MTKLVLTNLTALRAKHGQAGLAAVRVAVAELVAADRARGIRTRLVAVDDGRTARTLGLPLVSDPADEEAVKQAVDAVAARWSPEYLLLLGSPDVVPMQELTSALFTGDPRRGDPDPTVPSDLPYACESPYSHDPGTFRGPTRVVGRLPDGTGCRDPAQLVRLLAAAAAHRSGPKEQLLPPFALTAAAWHSSSVTTLTKVAGDAAALTDVPPDGPPWAPELVGRRMHLLNLHGGVADPLFSGQKGRSFPVALDAGTLSSVLTPGTVAAAECCYGALLYDPADAAGAPGFGDAYLAAGAAGYCASTTTAYGPAAGNDAADLVCGSFLRHVLSGASLGRAMLQARQDYVFTKATLSPVDLKTLAQFVLLGDPSIHPVERPGALVGAADGGVSPKARPGAGAPPSGIAARRRRLESNGRALHDSTTHAAAEARRPGAAEAERVRAALARRPGGTRRVERDPGELRTFDVLPAGGAAPGPQERFHVLAEPQARGHGLVVVREESGTVQQVTRLVPR